MFLLWCFPCVFLPPFLVGLVLAWALAGFPGLPPRTETPLWTALRRSREARGG